MKRPTGPRRVRAAALPLLIALAACRTTPLPEPDPGPPLPPVATRVRHFAGSPLAGAHGAAEPLETSEDPAAAWRVRFGAARVEELPPEPLAPLGERVRLIAAARGDAPILAAPPVARHARVGTGEPARDLLAALAAGELGAVIEVPSVEGALLPGVTTQLSLDALEPTPSARGPAREHVALALHRAPGAGDGAAALEVWLEVEDVAAARAAERDDGLPGDALLDDRADIGAAPAPAEPVADALGTAEPAGPPQLAHRVILELADAPGPGDVLVLVVPAPFDVGERGGYLLWAEVEAAPEDEAAAAAHARVVRRALADLEAERALVADLAPRPRGSSLREREVAAAIDALLTGPRGRAMLVFLAEATDAAVAEDVALTAAESDLAELVRRVRSALRGADAPRAPAAVGWRLEREALAWLAARREAETLPPELLAVLIAHAGEAARQSGLVEDALARSADPGALAVALAEENRILLEDPSPGARVRAQRWLAERGLVPAGYEATAPKSERRAALARAERVAAELAAQAAAEPAKESPAAEPARGDGDATGAESREEPTERQPGDER